MYWRGVLIAIGCALIAAAAFVSNADISRALLSDTSRTLSWGPALFRSLLVVHGLALAFVAVSFSRNDCAVKDSADARRARKDSSPQTSRLSWAALIILSIIALSLRLWRLESDLWVDEVFTLLDFVRLPIGEIITRFPNQNQHMLFSIMSHASMSTLGSSIWALRLPSVLFGVGSLWALFFLGRKTLGTREALLACALMSVSYHHVWFSQNARGYMGLLFFTLLATWLWLEALTQSRWSWWMGYAVAGAFGLWIHLTMAFVLAAHALLYAVLLVRPVEKAKQGKARGLERAAGWRPLVAWALCASLTLQMYALALPEFLHTGLHEESLESEWTSPIWIVMETLRGLRVGFVGIAVVLCGGALVAVGWASMFRRDKRAGVLMFLPALLAGSTMLVLGHNLWPRFFFFSMGFALLVAVHGAMKFPQLLCVYAPAVRLGENFGRVAGVALTCLMIAASAATLPRNYALPKQDFSGARDYVERTKERADAVVAVGLAGVIYGRYLAPQWSVAQTREELNKVSREHKRVWLVFTLPIEVKAYRPEIWNAIQNDFEVVKVFPGTLGGGEVYVYQQRPAKEFANESSRNPPRNAKTDFVW